MKRKLEGISRLEPTPTPPPTPTSSGVQVKRGAGLRAAHGNEKKVSARSNGGAGSLPNSTLPPAGVNSKIDPAGLRQILVRRRYLGGGCYLYTPATWQRQTITRQAGTVQCNDRHNQE